MPVYHRHKLVHIHIPKTGGTAIESYFHDLGDMEWGLASWLGQERVGERWYEFQHLTRQELQEQAGAAYDDFRSFAVVRDPYQRFLSDYAWFRAVHADRFQSIHEFAAAIPRDIDRRWDALASQADQPATNLLIHARPQSHYVFDQSGRLLVDEILRFESLAEDLARFLEPLGLTPDFVRVPRRRSLDVLDGSLIALLNTLYARDFERFDYPMETP